MKRRSLLKSVAALPAAASLPAAAQGQNAPAQPASDNLKLELTALNAAAQQVPRFFTPVQLGTLRKLGELFVPAVASRPGAREAGAAEFLDFYISQSAADRQKLFRDGLDRLEAEARKAYRKGFTELTEAESATILKPATNAWTYAGPVDPFAKFLLAAKDELFRATTNSRAWAAATATTSRGGAGLGYYWLPIE